MTRYLRITAAVFFALLAVALIGLWVRSFHRSDFLWCEIPNSRRLQLSSYDSRVVLRLFDRNPAFDNSPDQPRRTSYPHIEFLGGRLPLGGLLGFDYSRRESFVSATIPYWFLFASSLAIAALFAFKRTWRFSVRALLITTTLVAAALGLGVYFI